MILLAFHGWKREIGSQYRQISDDYSSRSKWVRIWDFVWTFLILTFFVPIYALSRIITFFYPFLCVFVALFGKNSYQWFVFDFSNVSDGNISFFEYLKEKIPYFPGLVTIVYFFLLIVVTILAIYSYKLMQLCFSIYPSRINYCDIGNFEVCIKHWNRIMAYYNWQQNKPMIDACIIDCIETRLDYSGLAIEIANIIIKFLPNTYQLDLDPPKRKYTWDATELRYY